MGDPKKQKKAYKTPFHPWEKERIDVEKSLSREYGLKNKKEIWRVNSQLANFKAQAKKCAAATTEQLQKEKTQLIKRLQRLGLLGAEAGLDDVLGLTVDDIMQRRLQTLVVKQKLATTVKQARQFIVHGHITLDGKKVTVPSVLVTKDLEGKIAVIK